MSNSLNFSHSYTPEDLAQINVSLEDVLAQETLDEPQLKILIDQRAKLVNLLLNTMQDQQKRCFAKAELKVNEQLVRLISAQTQQVKDELAGYAKASKAIKQYHQV
ncbi:hypothetical protein KJ365_07925 [Glaciecola sp. XM2]|uniref:hypothetical protein n=1 Tax=Glaciecola sp. XM2 TaxID=1914931 RepID=UPI001BDE9DDB|nr:hypothetical protein [Glaciecola sp. XM2]MBT1450810.1 hypothetical protein [Glaciecola sp. XM2]